MINDEEACSQLFPSQLGPTAVKRIQGDVLFISDTLCYD